MPSSKDVAKKAGVSQTTVSRVLNNPLAVSEKTRAKVMEAIEALGYIPDANARSPMKLTEADVGKIYQACYHGKAFC